ncbi:MAG: hypothetical protein EOO15_18285 [Chitinophagaceae bacterium]|nr:MAG: hypothetical protein EOO15_18285 [Chitinophagaceae bacterium]
MKRIALFAIVLATLASCKKSSETTNNNTPGASGFTWTEGSGAAITADSAYFTAAFNTLIVWKQGLGKHIEINLSAGTPATYNFSSGNAFTLITGGSSYAASGGSLTVSSNANGKISGTFSTSGSGASLTAVTGSFTDIPVR